MNWTEEQFAEYQKRAGSNEPEVSTIIKTIVTAKF